MDWDSLPPLNVPSANAAQERQLALEVFEKAVFLSILNQDKQNFERSVATLRGYYSAGMSSANHSTILGLQLLFLLVENKLAEFHCELHSLTEAQLAHPHISFCTQLDQYLSVGSYDQVMTAAEKPPVPQFKFFLNSMLEMVRTNIAECAAVSYSTLTVQGATEILMFSSQTDTLAFISSRYPHWVVAGTKIDLRASKQAKGEEIDSINLIQTTLGYATEMERIV
jgi:26S proteasome regulatory subunit N12